MKSLNRVSFIGHLAADVDLRQTKNGHTLAVFPLATNRFVKKSDGERGEVADFHRIVAWGKLAEICDKYLSKGLGVYLEGSLVNSSYEKNGEKHYRTEIVADNLNILTWKRGKNGKDEVGMRELNDNVDEVSISTEA